MNLENYKIALDVVDDIQYVHGIYDTVELKEFLEEAIKKKEEENDRELKESNTISIEDAPDYEDFRDIVEEILHERLCDQTPHGEYGGDISDEFYWKDKVWKCTYSPDWNRYDKQYYYIDNFGGNHLNIVEID